MKKNPFFSVIIPTLNEEKYLPTLLSSLGKQTFRDFEVLVVDGHSQDKTREVYEKFSSVLPSSAFILSQKQNVGYQRNLGAKKARGEYLVFFDADVNIEPTFLEEIHLAALKKKFSLATTWIVPDSQKPIDQLMILLGNLLMELAKGVNLQFTGGYNTIIKKKTFFSLGGFREDLKINEDHDLALRAGRRKIECVILKEPRLTYSLRRLRSEGTLRLLHKYTYAQIYNLLKGPITSELFDYQMGGHVHQKRKKTKSSLVKFSQRFFSKEQWEKKLSQFFKE